jgi:EAL domain-containing protein (putative c-di-GMP-specific phosphodiesterase class I)
MEPRWGVRDRDLRIAGLAGPRRPYEPVTSLADGRGRVERLLRRRDLQIALQPVISVRGGQWTAVEALARFPDGRAPDAWFAEARAAGLGAELEMLAIVEALRAATSLPHDIDMSINASPALLLDTRLADTLTASGLPLRQLTVEISAHTAVPDYERIGASLRPLRERGLRVAVDETGAGYASFDHLLRLRPDVIKLDRSLLADVARDHGRRAFVTMIVLLALKVGATVTGEGVETREELDALTALGVDHVQGTFLARPEVSPAAWMGWPARAWLPREVLA